MVTVVKGIGIKIGGSQPDIRGLYRTKTSAGSFRAYQTIQANGQYPSLIGPEEWARKSCRHERIGHFAEFEVALHSDIDVKRRLFSPVIVLQAEFLPEQQLRHMFYLRNEALIEPTTGKLLLVISEDYRREHAGGFTHDQNVDRLYESDLFDLFYPQLKLMFGIFREIAVKEGFTKFWGFGGEFSPPGPAGIPARAEILIERLRAVGDQKVTLKLAEDIFGVSVEEGKASVELRKLYRRTIPLIHPDRNKSPDLELLSRLLNDAFSFFKG